MHRIAAICEICIVLIRLCPYILAYKAVKSNWIPLEREKSPIFRTDNYFQSELPLKFQKTVHTIKSTINHDISLLSTSNSPLNSLKNGKWVKLICGASNHDLPMIRDLCYVYTVAGVDCIDVSADPAVVNTASEGVSAALRDYKITTKPILMISVNDDEDPHFRKASFDINKCPNDCPRPCERICPAFAIPKIIRPSGINSKMIQEIHAFTDGVIAEKCYGCGRCLSVCPIGNINASSYKVDADGIKSLFSSGLVSGIEIHTQPGHQLHFFELWNQISTSVLPSAQVIAVSFPNMGNATWSYINDLNRVISNDQMYRSFNGFHIWQADGRPMSGDVGRGTTYATCELANRIFNDFDTWKRYQNGSTSSDFIDFESGKHFIQLAGGANDYSPILVNEMKLSNRKGFGGYGFGGFARKKISTILAPLNELCQQNVESQTEILSASLDFANRLISAIKN